MNFLVYDRRKGADEPVDDLGSLVTGITDWLGCLKDMQKTGKVVCHWAFHNHHGSITVFDVASGEELKEILKKNPMDERWITREIYQVETLDKEMDNVFRYMSGV